MKLVNLEGLGKIKKSTPIEVQEFLDNHVREVLKFMVSEQNDMPFLYLHATQVGLKYNIIIDLTNPKSPGMLINPRYIPLSKRKLRNQEFSYSYPDVLLNTTRFRKIRCIHEDFKGVDKKLKANSKVYKDIDAIFIQQLCDLSQGIQLNSNNSLSD